MSFDRGRRLERRAEHRPHLHPPQAARPSGRRADEIIAGAAAASSPAIPGITRLPAEPAAHPHRRPAHQEPSTSSRCRTPTLQTLYQWAPLLVRQAARAAGLPGRQLATCRSRTRRCIVEIDRDKASALGVTADADRERALQRLRLAPGLDHLHADQPVLGDPGARCRSTSAIPPRSRMLYVRSASGQARAARRGRHADAGRSGPLTVNHLGQLPAVTLSFNLQPGRLARRRRRSRSRSWQRELRLPATHQHELPGHGAGLPVARCRAWGCCSLVAVLVIYMVLGILYESFIHPLTILSGPAVGRLRRAADAACSSTRS